MSTLSKNTAPDAAAAKDEAMSQAQSDFPEGFTTFDLSYDNYEAWDWNEHPMLIGVVTTQKVVPLKRKGVLTDVNMTVIDVGGTEFAIWETAQLKQWQEKTFSGQKVAIKFCGMENVKGGKRLRNFEVRVSG